MFLQSSGARRLDPCCQTRRQTLFTRTRPGSPVNGDADKLARSSRVVSRSVGKSELVVSSDPRREEAGWERGFGEAQMDLGGPDAAALSPAIPACIIVEVIVVLELR